jgi:hypothetical protein
LILSRIEQSHKTCAANKPLRFTDDYSFMGALTFHALHDREAFGLVVAEDLSHNLKFFGSRAGGIPDIASET